MVSTTQVVPQVVLIVTLCILILAFFAFVLNKKVDSIFFVMFAIGAAGGLIYFFSVVISNDYTHTTALYLFMRIVFYAFMGISLLLAISFVLSIKMNKIFFVILIAISLTAIIMEVYWWNNFLPQLFLIIMEAVFYLFDLIKPKVDAFYYTKIVQHETTSSQYKEMHHNKKKAKEKKLELKLIFHFFVLLCISAQLFLLLSKVWCPGLVYQIMLILFCASYTVANGIRIKNK